MNEESEKPNSVTEQDRESGFLQRWSRRKHATRSESDIESAPATETAAIAKPRREQAAELKTDADMPPIEQLTETSDYSGFLSPKVSEQLRRQALRKLFHMPSLNIVDGLDDYAEDFTAFASLGDIVPQDMRREMAREKARLEQEQVAQQADAEIQQRPKGSVDGIDDDEAGSNLEAGVTARHDAETTEPDTTEPDTPETKTL